MLYCSELDPAKLKNCKLDKPLSHSGMDPVRQVLARFSSVNAVNALRTTGIIPRTPVLAKLRFTKAPNDVKDAGRVVSSMPLQEPV
jgi:hypothetical protein